MADVKKLKDPHREKIAESLSEATFVTTSRLLGAITENVVFGILFLG
jgi:hypothetical protein